jgi:hypothetical protein
VAPAASKVAAALDALQPEAGRSGSYHLVSARHDFPDEWRRWERSPDEPLKLTFMRAHLPFALQSPAKLKSGLVLWATPDVFLTDADLTAAPAVTIVSRTGDSVAWDLTIRAPANTPCEEAYLLLNYSIGTE